MAGRLQVLVLVVAVAAQPSMQLRFRDVQYGVAERCENIAGEQAFADLINLQSTFINCTRLEELYGQTVIAYSTKGTKEAIKTVCRRKDELLPCFDQASETIRRCLYEEEQHTFDVLHRGIEPAMDFVCEHDDEIAAIQGSTEEQQCLMRFAEMAKRCNPYKSHGAEEALNSLKLLQQECKKFDGFIDCFIPENCKESAAASLINDLKKKVVDDGICSKIYVTSAAAAKAHVGYLPEPLGRLILAVAVPYILHL